MGQDRLSSLAILQINLSASIDFKKIIDEFTANGVGEKRKLALKY
jgi:hypothetical protein